MPDFLLKAGYQLPFILLLLAVLGFRWRVNPRVSLHIAAAPETVFALLDFREGEEQRWQRTKVRCELLDQAAQRYRLTFTTPLATGAVQSSTAQFSIARRQPPGLIDIRREGLESVGPNNQLLRMVGDLAAEGGGTRLRLAYEWGPRPAIAQLTARADLWGSAYRLKGVAETGVPDFRTDHLISAAVALVTGLVSLATFAFAFGWFLALVLVGALLVHELGHLLAYRLIGQPWGRLVFLPFLGAVALPRIGFTSQGQSVFAAIMGPGVSVVVPLAAALYTLWRPAGIDHDIAVGAGLVGAALNLFNLLPVEPLDGGVVLRSVLARLFGSFARFGLIAIGFAILMLGWYSEQVLLLIFGGIAVLANLRTRTIDPGLVPLSRLQVAISAFGFLSVVAAYTALARHFLNEIH